jgi:formate C-acetyltransferase
LPAYAWVLLFAKNFERNEYIMANFDYPISERVKALKAKRERINRDLRLNFERNRILTDYFKAHEKQYPVLKKAGFLYQWCATARKTSTTTIYSSATGGPHCRTLHFDTSRRAKAGSALLRDTDERFRAAWQVPGCVWVRTRTANDSRSGRLLGRPDFAATSRGFMSDEELENAGPFLNYMNGTYPGHFNPNYERAVTVGFGTVRQIALEKLDEIVRHTTADNVRSELFYRGLVRVCDGMMLMSKRYAKACREEAGPPRRRAPRRAAQNGSFMRLDHRASR